MKLLEFQRRSDVVSCQPTLTKADWDRLREAVARHEQLTCNLPEYGIEDRDYWITYLNKGGGWPECKSALFMLFRPLDDHPNDPIVVYHFARLPNGDWCWLRGEEYDNELSDDECLEIFNKRRI